MPSVCAAAVALPFLAVLTASAGPDRLVIGHGDPLACGACFGVDDLRVIEEPGDPFVRPANSIYLNAAAGVTVQLGASMSAEPFANRTAAASLASFTELADEQISDNRHAAQHRVHTETRHQDAIEFDPFAIGPNPAIRG